MIRREFSTSLKKVSESITKLCKVEKESMLALDEVEEKCQSLSRMVEAMAKKLVKLLLHVPHSQVSLFQVCYAQYLKNEASLSYKC